MIILLSPTKKQEWGTSLYTEMSTPLFQDKTMELVEYLQTLSIDDIKECMKISESLAETVYGVYQDFGNKTTSALSLFTGEAFRSLNPQTFTNEELSFAQKDLVILSGLYGVLSPSDAVSPYRLEIAYKLKKYPNLYSFWKEGVNTFLIEKVKRDRDNVVINLASKEYYKIVNFNALHAKVITPNFKEYKNGKYKVVSMYAKKARGLFARFIIKNNGNVDLKSFCEEGYQFNKELSSESEYVFTR